MKRSILTATTVAAIAVVAACSPNDDPSAPGSDDEPSAAAAAPAKLSSNVEQSASGVKVDTAVTTTVAGGTIEKARLYFGGNPAKNAVGGTVSGDTWVANSLLEPGQSYHLVATAKNADGKVTELKRDFTTQQLTLDQQTYPSVAPLKGETVGVGMPIVVTFDVPVTNKAVFERKMRITSSTPVEGSWHWYGDTVAHYRPKEYWPANATINVDLRLNSLPAGDGVYGQQNQRFSFRTGDRVISTVDVARHQLKYTVNGKVVKRIPVTTGDATHQTREGTKVIMEKFDSVDMDAASTGVDADAPDYYNIKGVKWAMRLTNSGEFLHAAPWSVGSQGVANVSHGCTGMSTANAAWLYTHSRRGDVVKYVNSSRPLEANNGWTDWNLSWSAWQKGSALDG